MKQLRKITTVAACSFFIIGSLSACTFGSEDFTLSKQVYTMETGDSVKLSPVMDGDPNRSSFQWESSDTLVATVHDGNVKAVDDGEATITATNNHGKSASCEITVKNPEVESISLNKQSVTIKKGKGSTLEAAVTPSNADISELSWSSSDESVALVNSSGYVTGVGKGVTNITCKAGSKSASCTVTVKAKKKKDSQTTVVVQAPASAPKSSSGIPTVSDGYISGTYASSELKQNKYSVAPGNVVDGSSATAWSEGVSGNGIGESITIQLSTACRVSGLNIMSGYQKSRDLYYKNSRPAEIRISFSDGSSETTTLDDEMGWQSVSFSSTHITDKVTIIIWSVYSGNKYTDTLISEVELW